MGLASDLWQALVDWAYSEDLVDILRVAIAAIIVYLIALWIARSGKHRFLGNKTIFDVLLAFILGSMLSRAINGSAGLISSALAGFTLVGVHYAFASLAARSRRFGHIVKGGFEEIVHDGQFLRDVMRAHHLTENDVMEAVRLHGLDNIGDVKTAWFERSGEISVVPHFRVRTVDIKVEEGVQTVRIEIHD